MDELVQLKWNIHHSTFIENLSRLRDKQVFTDVTISCGDQFYPAHRLVLSACSSFFSRALSVATCKSPVLLLHGIEQSTLEELLVFMYDGEVTIKQSNLPKLLAAARWLGITGLENHMNSTDDSAAINVWTLFNQLLSSSRHSMTPGEIADMLHQIRNSLEHDKSPDTSNMELTHLPSKELSVRSDDSEASVEFKPILIEGDPGNLLGNSLLPNENSKDNSETVKCSYPNYHEHFMNVRSCSRQSNESSSFEGWDDESVKDRRRSLDQFVNLKNIDSPDESSQDIVLQYDGSSSEPEKENISRKARTSSQRSLCCKFCKVKFKVQKELVEHLKTHDILQNYCVICEKKFSTAQGLERHMDDVFHCTICRYTTHDEKSMAVHLNSHTSEGDLTGKPENSDAQTISQEHQNLGDCLESVLPSESFSCFSCSECFSNYQDLNNHVNKNCSKLVCTHCNKTFLSTQKKKYLRHLQVHKSRKLFSCTVCPYVTDRRRSLADHISVHTGEYRFKCSMCNYKCTRNAALRSHIEKKHKEMKNKLY